jgi:hypothetical protein
MPRARRLIIGVLGAALPAAAFLPQVAHGSTPRSAGGAQTIAAVHQDVSAPLASMLRAPSSTTPHEHPQRPLPTGTQAGGPDAALQTTAGPAVATTSGLSFAGVGDGDYGFAPSTVPADPNLSVGATQIVQWVNESFAVFDKTTGAIVAGPSAGNSLWSGFGGGCESNNDGDPIVKYDQIAQRWVFSQFSVSTTPYLQCLAVSTTSDATGTYNRYAFSFGTADTPDYPKLGVWPDAYYMTFNIFNAKTFAGARLCALDRASMLSGAAATMQCFQQSPSVGGVLPSDLDGSTLPPTGSPDYMLDFGSNSLNEWKFHVDFANSANTTLTGPFNIPVAAFTPACGGGVCIPQPGTHTQLDSLADRLMYRLAYRNFGTFESLVVDHSVAVSGGKKRSQTSGVRWYELRNPNGSAGATVFQQATYAPDSTSRWMGSIAMDKVGDIAVGYSASSGTVFPSLRMTGRVPGDAIDTLEAENSILAGGGSQNGNVHRWGDYSSMALDPGNDCTFFYTNEYLKTSGSFNWSTWIASFKFPGCV